MTASVFHPADDQFTVTVTGDVRAVCVTAVGELDACSAPQLTAALAGPAAESAAEVTVDLEGVTFLNSSGVHALAAGYRRATAAGRRMRVVAPHRAVRRPLEVCGLGPLLGADRGGPGAASAAER